MKQQATQQQGFGSKIGFVLAAAGSAVGLGNIWRFPTQVANHGGGAFVLAYLISIVLLGSIVMIAEMYIGKRAQTNVVDSYGKVHSKLKWVGLLAVIVPFIIASYYGVIGAWTSSYALDYILRPDLIQAGTAGAMFTSMISDYIHPILFLVLFMGASIFIVCGGVQKGIEKASKFMMPTLFALLVFVVIYAMFLPGQGAGAEVSDGIKYYIGQFDFKALGWAGMASAMGQAFFSLSLGMGAMIAYGSYTNKKINIASSAGMVCIFDSIIAILAGFAIFPAMFATGNAGLVQEAGAGLLFIALPEVFAVMPGGELIGFAFFTLVLFAAMTSIISLIEVVSQYTIKKLNWSRAKATLIFGGIITLLGLFVSLSQGAIPYTIFGFDLLTYFDEVTNTVIMPLLAFMSVITIGWIIKPKTVLLELKEMNSDFKLAKAWIYTAKFITPLLIGVVLIMGVYGKWEQFANSATPLNFGYVLLGAIVLIIGAIVWNIVIDSKKYQDKKIKQV